MFNQSQKGLQLFKNSNKLVAQSLTPLSCVSLVNQNKYNKISYQTKNQYNKRWQYKWRHAYYTYTRDGEEHTFVHKPQDSPDRVRQFYAYYADLMYRGVPTLRTLVDRRLRWTDTFNLYVLPATSLLLYQFYDLNFGFKVLTLLPWALMYTRTRDRVLDPDMKETYLRDLLYQNAEITKYFNEESIHVLDYEMEYDSHVDTEKFPEYKNKVWRFFNNDTGMCTGFFKFGDVDSGATMTLNFKTMPAPGKFRYQVGEPFYFYDLRASIVHNGLLKEVVLVNEAETLKRIRPFLYLI